MDTVDYGQEEQRLLGGYEILDRLGSGGMGVVYRARDVENGRIVALKTLRKLDPAGLMRLKNEFRYVANVTHERLVALYELVSCDGQWFFTMEYVPGQSLQAVFRDAMETGRTLGGGITTTGSHLETAADACAADEPDMAHTPTMTGLVDDGVGAAWNPEPQGPPPAALTHDDAQNCEPLLPVDELRRIFRALGEGISALHASDRVHCDIKPANVMVSPDGRVVLLDFGLSLDSNERPYEQSDGPTLAGTPSYMSPEQADGKQATTASDWYAFGTMLYEALSGQQPFEGAMADLLMAKRVMPAPELPTDLPAPADLCELAMALLATDPKDRPSGHEVHRVLGGERIEALLARRLEARELVGRIEQMALLRDAFERVRDDAPVTLHVRGRSGMGKSALVDRFLRSLRYEGAGVLTGRCYERESVPYNAFDSLVDSLTRHLRVLPTVELAPLLSSDVAHLARMFPVLQRVRAIRDLAQQTTLEVLEATQQRRAAFKALKGLLRQLSRRGPLVLFIDDLQWGDVASARIMAELVTHPKPPQLLLLLSYRTEEAGSSPFLKEQKRLAETLRDQMDVRQVDVGPLITSEAEQLAASLMGPESAQGHISRVARESQGNPFYIGELARYATSQGQQAQQAQMLDRVVLTRAARLGEEHRRVLEVIATAGRPLPQGVVLGAARVTGDRVAILSALRSAHLIVTQGIRDRDPVECYHDRVRQSVYEALDEPTRRQRHVEIGNALEKDAGADPELLAVHFMTGGDVNKAGKYSELAAESCVAKLAFDRAAGFYTQALECRPENMGLHPRLADALANAGRCFDAAQRYEQAALHESNGHAGFDLSRRAAEQYLIGGHMEQGVSALRPLLAATGLRYPRSPMTALLGMIGRLIRLDMTGTDFTPVDAATLAPEVTRRIDTAWAAGKGLGSTDIMRGAYFIVQATGLAIGAREARRAAMGLAQVGLFTVARGTPREEKKGWQLLARAEAIGQDLDDPHLLGFAQINAGTAHMTLGNWRKATELLDSGTATLEDECTGVAWECSFANAVNCNVLRLLGEVRDLAERGTTWLRTAEERGDLYGATWCRLHTTAALMAADDASSALEHLKQTVEGWRADVFTPQHVLGILLAGEIDLYRGRPERAVERIDAAWKTAFKSFAMGWQVNRVFTTQVRAGALIAMARGQSGAGRQQTIRRARKDIQRVRKERRHYAVAAANGLDAALASLAGHTDQAIALTDRAIEGYEAADMALYTAAYRNRKAALLGGQAGADLATAARYAFERAGVRDAGAWTEMYAPGYHG